MGVLKAFATVSFLFSFAIFASATVADISYYGSSSTLDSSGNAKVELILTFENPIREFAFDIRGRVENFKATSFGIPVQCTPVIRGVTTVICKLNLNEARKTIQINYDTKDYVKQLGNKYFFDADFSMDQNMPRTTVSVRLPEATALVSEDGKPQRLSFAENATITSDGRIIIVTWNMQNITSDKRLEFEIYYESLVVPFWAELRIRYIVIFAVVTGIVVALILMRKSRKSQELVLSVLDEFEKKVIDVIVKAEGEINQKKVVQETNLSKAKVSRVVKSLIERGLIEAQRLGRTNKLKLVKKKFKM